MSDFSIEYRDIKKRWPFWMRAGGLEEFHTAEAAEAWVREPKNQLQFGGDTCYPQKLIPTVIRIIKNDLIKEFVIK